MQKIPWTWGDSALLLLVLLIGLWYGRTLLFPPASSEPPWQSMATAPRDGTVVEIQCRYGIRPWYDLMRWTATKEIVNLATNMPAGTVQLPSPEWSSVTKPGIGLMSEERVQWRPYTGDPQHYRDPTNGAQETADYWDPWRSHTRE